MRHLIHRGALVVVTGLLIAGPATTLAAAASGRIQVTVTADASAPSGVLPKVSFHVTGVQRHIRYFVFWRLNPSGAIKVRCTGEGTTHTVRAQSDTVVLGPTPGGAYDSSSYRGLCPGHSYHGQLYGDTAAGDHEVATFTFRAPGVRP